MTVDQDYNVQKGNMFAQFNSLEIKIGLVGSLSNKRETLHRGIESLADIFRYVEVMLGEIPDMTVGWTNKRMAEFARRRFGMDVEPVKTLDGEGKAHVRYRVTGTSKEVMDKVALLMPDDNDMNTERLSRK